MTPEQRIEAMSNREYMGYVARLSCLPCRLRGIDGTPAQVHHARKFGGLRNLRHKDTLPACPWHHTEAPDSIHRERNRVEENYGMSEDEMVDRTRRDVAELISQDVRYAA